MSGKAPNAHYRGHGWRTEDDDHLLKLINNNTVNPSDTSNKTLTSIVTDHFKTVFKTSSSGVRRLREKLRNYSLNETLSGAKSKYLIFCPLP